MFLHIGENEIVTIKDIIGVFSVDLMEKNKNNRKVKKKARSESRWFKVSRKNDKSMVLTQRDEYIISPISVSTLRKRITNFDLNFGKNERGVE